VPSLRNLAAPRATPLRRLAGAMLDSTKGCTAWVAASLCHLQARTNAVLRGVLALRIRA
jgi:hypothetical protein